MGKSFTAPPAGASPFCQHLLSSSGSDHRRVASQGLQRRTWAQRLTSCSRTGLQWPAASSKLQRPAASSRLQRARRVQPPGGRCSRTEAADRAAPRCRARLVPQSQRTPSEAGAGLHRLQPACRTRVPQPPAAPGRHSRLPHPAAGPPAARLPHLPQPACSCTGLLSPSACSAASLDCCFWAYAGRQVHWWLWISLQKAWPRVCSWKEMKVGEDKGAGHLQIILCSTQDRWVERTKPLSMRGQKEILCVCSTQVCKMQATQANLQHYQGTLKNSSIDRLCVWTGESSQPASSPSWASSRGCKIFLKLPPQVAECQSNHEDQKGFELHPQSYHLIILELHCLPEHYGQAVLQQMLEHCAQRFPSQRA